MTEDISYHRLKDDGADWRCQDCKEMLPASAVVVYTVRGRKQLVCMACLDENLGPGWLSRVRETPKQ